MKEKHWFSLAELQNSKPLPMCSTGASWPAVGKLSHEETC